jgi:hypothetical protein
LLSIGKVGDSLLCCERFLNRTIFVLSSPLNGALIRRKRFLSFALLLRPLVGDRPFAFGKSLCLGLFLFLEGRLVGLLLVSKGFSLNPDLGFKGEAFLLVGNFLLFLLFSLDSGDRIRNFLGPFDSALIRPRYLFGEVENLVWIERAIG